MSAFAGLAPPDAETYCLCGSSDDGRLMIECTANAHGCGGWIHPECFGMGPEALARAESDENWACPLCCGEVGDEEAARARARALAAQHAQLATLATGSGAAPVLAAGAEPGEDDEESDDDSDDSEDGAPAKRAKTGGGQGKAKKFKRGPDPKPKGGPKPKKASHVRPLPLPVRVSHAAHFSSPRRRRVWPVVGAVWPPRVCRHPPRPLDGRTSASGPARPPKGASPSLPLCVPSCWR